MPVQHRPDVLGRMVEISHRHQQLDVGVAGGGDVGERALEVLTCRVAQGVELHTDPLEAAAARGAGSSCCACRGGSEQRGAERLDEGASVHATILWCRVEGPKVRARTRVPPCPGTAELRLTGAEATEKHEGAETAALLNGNSIARGGAERTEQGR